MFWIQVTTRLLFFQPLLCGHRHRHDQRLPKLAVGDATVYEWTKLSLEILPRSKAKRLWEVYETIYKYIYTCINHRHHAQCGHSPIHFCGVGGWTNFTWGASGRFVTAWQGQAFLMMKVVLVGGMSQIWLNHLSFFQLVQYWKVAQFFTREDCVCGNSM